MMTQTRFYGAVFFLVLLIGIGGFLGRGRVAQHYLNKGRITLAELNVGATKKAETFFSRSVFFDSRNPITYAYLGRIALSKYDSESPDPYPYADYPRVIQMYEKAIGLGLEEASESFYLVALDSLGISYKQLGNNDKSNEAYLKVIASNPSNSFWPRFLVAKDYTARLNEPDKALALLANIENLPDFPDQDGYQSLALVARLWSFKGDSVKAKEYAAKSIQEAPEGTSDLELQRAHLTLAQEYASDKNEKRSLEELQQAEAVAILDGSQVEQCVVARVYMLLGSPQKAIDIASSRLQAGDNFSYLETICIEALRMSYLQLGDTEKAKLYAQKYLDITDAFEEKNIYVVRNRAEANSFIAQQ